MNPPPPGWPRLSSCLYYEDAATAIDWLCDAFGFEVRLRVEDDAGRIVHSELTTMFGLRQPRIVVLGLNPHAGESGHLGREEIDVIAPVLQSLQAAGMSVLGPVPADTAFLPERLQRCDAVVAMYHDQGLPVLKHAGFGHAVNVTLGLPVVRTSVDHGTALDLAGTGRADAGSLAAATLLASEFAARHQRARH